MRVFVSGVERDRVGLKMASISDLQEIAEQEDVDIMGNGDDDTAPIGQSVPKTITAKFENHHLPSESKDGLLQNERVAPTNDLKRPLDDDGSNPTPLEETVAAGAGAATTTILGKPRGPRQKNDAAAAPITTTTTADHQQSSPPPTKRAKFQTQRRMVPSSRPPSHLVLPDAHHQQAQAQYSQDALAPGEALKTWLEQNKTVEEEEALIEELPEEAPSHQPSADELAADAVCKEFEIVLQGLTRTNTAIELATGAALKAAAVGASARVVRLVLSVAAGAPSSRHRLPFLFLLDSAIKSEIRMGAVQEKTTENDGIEASNVMQPALRRAVGAALPRLIDLLLGDAVIRPKIEKLLNIWKREGFVADSVIDPVIEAVKRDAEKEREAAAAMAAAVKAILREEREKELMSLLRETPMNARMTLTYTMPVRLLTL